MLKINFPLLDDSLTISNGTILVIEDVSVYASLIKSFYAYQEDQRLKLFDTKYNALKASELMIVTDILGYDINSAAILKLIHSNLEERFNDKPEVKSIVEKLANSITELIAFECLEDELDLEYDEITILELIKALGVRVETRSDTIFEKCFEIIQIFRYLSKKRLLVFVNIASYLTSEELDKVLEYIELSQLDVLFLEPRKLKEFPLYILDEDYVLLDYTKISI